MIKHALLGRGRQPVAAPQLRAVVRDERADLFAGGGRGFGAQSEVRCVRASREEEDDER